MNLETSELRKENRRRPVVYSRLCLIYWILWVGTIFIWSLLNMGLLVLNQNWRFSVSVVFGHDSNIVRSLIFEFFSFQDQAQKWTKSEGRQHQKSNQCKALNHCINGFGGHYHGWWLSWSTTFIFPLGTPTDLSYSKTKVLSYTNFWSLTIWIISGNIIPYGKVNEIQHIQLDYQSDPRQGSVDTDTALDSRFLCIRAWVRTRTNSEQFRVWQTEPMSQVSLSLRVCTWSILNLEGKV